MWLTELKTTDFEPKKKYNFVISLGSTEQHGPFLPLGTDTYSHDAILKKAHGSLHKVVFLPTIPITCSEEHAGFPGTVWIKNETLCLVLQDICDSLRDCAKNIIFISWHGGNIGEMKRFVATEQKKFKPIKLFHVNMDDETANRKAETLIKGPLDEHAGNTEISMMLAINPKLVQKPNNKKHPKHNFNHDWIKHHVKDSSPDGIVDRHPKWVISKQLGKKFIDLYAKLLVREIKKVAK